MQIDSSILEIIAQQPNHSLSFSAAYLRLEKCTLIIATVYLYCNEGFTERNNNILFQPQLLRDLTGLPTLIHGDFTMNSNELENAGWLDRLGTTLFN